MAPRTRRLDQAGLGNRPRGRRPASTPDDSGRHAHLTRNERDSDWFGTTVNLAARVAGEAAGGEVLLTELRERRLPLFRPSPLESVVGCNCETSPSRFCCSGRSDEVSSPPGTFRSIRFAGWPSTPGALRVRCDTAAPSTSSVRWSVPAALPRSRSATPPRRSSRSRGQARSEGVEPRC